MFGIVASANGRCRCNKDGSLCDLVQVFHHRVNGSKVQDPWALHHLKPDTLQPISISKSDNIALAP